MSCQRNKTILVIGHTRPDLDSVASAVVYAALLRERGRDANAGRAGPLDEQSSWALERFGVEPPPVVLDVAPTFGSIASHGQSARTTITVMEAVTKLAQGERAIPVVDETRQPLALLDPRACVAALGAALRQDGDDCKVALLLEHARQAMFPAQGAGLSKPKLFPAAERLSDHRRALIADDADDFLVVDDKGAYVGIAARSDALAPPRTPLVLVDHNELRQSVPGAVEAEIIEVVDHHRLDNPTTKIPIPFMVEPVGCTATLIEERWRAHSSPIPKPYGGLLLSAIMSDTLGFRSPTTTDRDRRAAKRLAELLEIADIGPFGDEVISAGAGLGQRSGREIVGEDYKEYSSAVGPLLISQAEVRALHEIDPRREALEEALEQWRGERNAVLALLLLTDPVRATSRIIACGNKRLIAKIPYPHAADGLIEARAVVSRKKQLVPALLAALDG